MGVLRITELLHEFRTVGRVLFGKDRCPAYLAETECIGKVPPVVCAYFKAPAIRYLDFVKLRGDYVIFAVLSVGVDSQVISTFLFAVVPWF